MWHRNRWISKCINTCNRDGIFVLSNLCSRIVFNFVSAGYERLINIISKLNTTHMGVTASTCMYEGKKASHNDGIADDGIHSHKGIIIANRTTSTFMWHRDSAGILSVWWVCSTFTSHITYHITQPSCSSFVHIQLIKTHTLKFWVNIIPTGQQPQRPMCTTN